MTRPVKIPFFFFFLRKQLRSRPRGDFSRSMCDYDYNGSCSLNPVSRAEVFIGATFQTAAGLWQVTVHRLRLEDRMSRGLSGLRFQRLGYVYESRCEQKVILQKTAHCTVLLYFYTVQPLYSKQWHYSFGVFHDSRTEWVYKRKLALRLFSGVAS